MARRVGIHTGCEFFRVKRGQPVRGGLPVVGGASLKRHALPRTRRTPPKPLRTPQVDAFTIGPVRPTVGFLNFRFFESEPQGSDNFPYYSNVGMTQVSPGDGSIK